MCSQRSTVCTRSRSGRRRRTRGAGGCTASAGLLSTAILDTCPPDLLVAPEIRRDRLRAEREVLLHQLIGAVLACRLDQHAVIALIDDVAPIVAAVPRDRVLARQPSRARHGRDEIGAAGALLL